MLDDKTLKQLISLRRTLHQHPELSGNEIKTAERIAVFLQKTKPDKLVSNIGGNGLIAEFLGKEEGPDIMFRCELDALPIEEGNTFRNRSLVVNTAHLCGHDGHMAILAGLATYLKDNRPDNGRIRLLFQPSEEVGKGASLVIEDPLFRQFEPDYIFALHNLPGIPLHEVVLAKQHFASASSGMFVQLKGKSSHAAEPEKGINPGMGMAQMIIAFHDMLKIQNFFQDFTLITPIHMRLGNIAYGTSPGDGDIHLTLRSYLDSDMKLLKKELHNLVKSISRREKLSYKINYEEVFPATVNDPSGVRIAEQAVRDLKLKSSYRREPFKWSEDFGHFTSKYTGAMFGIGSGTEQPALHNPDFDFPDELISTGTALFINICRQILSFKN
jgi:amidohydrolase